MLAALEHAVYSNLDDDGPRAVLADALIEAGDPRGELIQLQLLGTRTAPQRAREQALLTRHAKTWLGPLLRVLETYRFERGFLAVVAIRQRKPKAVAALVGHPLWRTVREVSGSALIALHPSLRALRVLDLASVDPAEAGARDAWRSVLCDAPRPIEKLVYAGPTRDPERGLAREELEGLRACAALPALRSLVVVCPHATGALAESLATAPVCARLEMLQLDIARSCPPAEGLIPFRALIAAAPVPRLAITLGVGAHATRLELERGAGGYARARLELGPDRRAVPAAQERFAAQGQAIVAALPRSVQRIAIEPRGHLALAVVAELRAAVAARPR